MSEPILPDRAALVDRDWWLARLAEPFFPAAPAPDDPGPERSVSVPIAADERTASRLAAVTGGSPVLAHAAVLAALQVVLWRHTGRRRIGIGVPVPEGAVAEALVITGTVDPRASFRERMVAARAALLDAYAHCAYPLSRLPIAQPLFGVLLAVGDHVPAAGQQLTLRLDVSAVGLTGTLTSDACGHLAGTVERFGAQVLATLDRGLAEPATRVGELDVRTRRER